MLGSRFTPFAPVPLEPEVALGVRGGLVVVLHLVGIRGEAVGPGRRDERLLVHPVGDAVCPAVQRRPQPCEVAGNILEHAEVGQREAGGLAALGLYDRRLPGLEIDVGRRRGGEDELAGAIRTPIESPAKRVPSSCSIETWWLA